ncbi:MAG: hypothetical protein ACI9SC_002937 [Gammaproteobacteria bacterium]|jgi:hypothetical protein
MPVSWHKKFLTKLIMINPYSKMSGYETVARGCNSREYILMEKKAGQHSAKILKFGDDL